LLRRADEEAAAAARQLAIGPPANAAESQQAAAAALDEAASKLEAAMRELAARQADQLAAASERTTALVNQAGQIDPGAAAALAQATRAARRGAKNSAAAEPLNIAAASQAGEQYEQKLGEATASLAAREQILRRDRNLAETLAELASQQQQARDAIREAAEQLEQLASQLRQPQLNFMPQKRQEIHDSQLAAASALTEAQQQFASAQLMTGQGAVEVSGQREVANQPIREGLELASRLSALAMAKAVKGQGEGGQEAGNGNQEPGDKGQETAGGQKSSGQGENSPGGRPGEKSLGTGLVPSSPEATAQQIAGGQADAAAKAAMAAAAQGQGQGEAGQGQSDAPKEGEASANATKGGAVKKGQSPPNQSGEKGELQTADAADADSRGELGEGTNVAAGGGKLESESWFARLPPSLQSAIQARSRGKAPRGYEERLRRYFESVD
jgi:hypothetical protein